MGNVFIKDLLSLLVQQKDGQTETDDVYTDDRQTGSASTAIVTCMYVCCVC